MAISFNCPDCGFRTTVHTLLPGEASHCRSCGRPIIVPSVSDPELDPAGERAARSPLSLAVAVAFLLLCAYESMVKGWFTLLLLPISLGLLPAEFLLQRRAIRAESRSEAPHRLRILRLIQLATLAGFYVCLPGVGDSSQYGLFGATMVPMDSPVVVVSWVLGWILLGIAAVTAIPLFLKTRKPAPIPDAAPLPPA